MSARISSVCLMLLATSGLAAKGWCDDTPQSTSYAPVSSAPVSDDLVSYEVMDNGLIRLPSTDSHPVVESLLIKPSGKFLIPASIHNLTVNHLVLQKQATISIAPREDNFMLTIKSAEIADGSVIAAQGSSGDLGVPGGKGTHLTLIVESGTIANLTIDARGGDGGQGWSGAAGEAGQDAACWGRGSSDGQAGGDGSDGLPGGDGGDVNLVLAQPHWLEVIDVIQHGGQGGLAGEAGKAGQGGHQASCWLYSRGRETDKGQAGLPGKPSYAGRQGILRVQGL